jgi:nitrilase
MPLLRQSLYCQNVNLYLAPTADARDTWLPLMRTVACEGRCVVLSANQCMRKSQLPGWITGKKDEETHVNGQRLPPKLRRKSTIVEDGNEIALPVLKKGEKTNINGQPSPPRLRRKSTIVEDGNEIVLPLLREETAEEKGVEEVSGGKKDSSEFVSRGGSCIISPLGDVLAGPLWDEEEGLLTVEVDVEDCLRGRLDLDVGGSYSRYVQCMSWRQSLMEVEMTLSNCQWRGSISVLHHDQFENNDNAITPTAAELI